MNIALLGKGKTGSRVLSLAGKIPGTTVTVFDRARPPERHALAGHDVIISFLPGDAFLEYIPELLASRVPVVSGSTGFDWPDGREKFSQRLKSEGLVWVHASNFSLGMNLMYEMIQILGMAGTLYDEYSFSIHEVHHTGKKDAPSGTALAWKRWLNQPVTVTSGRTGDVIGEHTLTLDTPFERITIHHSARDRQLFASGALWTARQILSGERAKQGDQAGHAPDPEAVPGPGPGLYDIQQLALARIGGNGAAA